LLANIGPSSTIIESVKAVCSASISRKYAYFYFDFRDTQKQDVATLLRSLLRQLCAGEEELPEEVHGLYTRYRDAGHHPPVGELTIALFSIIDGLKKEVYLIMDALDEYPETSKESQRQELLDLIKQIVEHESETLHVLITSRNEADIRATLGALAGGGTSIQRGEVDADIKVYVRTQLKNESFARLPQNLKQDIEENLGKKANGM
jgi:ankyrin repeat domain-containing protein 50